MRVFVITSILILSAATSIRALGFAGPRAFPENYLDYGGTPDLSLSGDVRLTLDELNALTDNLGSDALDVRIQAAAEIQRSAAGCESVFRKALWQSGTFNYRELKEAMQQAMADDDVAGDSVGKLLQISPRTPAVNFATRIMVMLVAMHSQDTMAGYKVLLDFSSRYAGVFRAAIGKMMVQAGLKALPALIYGRGSKNRELHMFSVAWIREMGDPLLSQQIQGIRNSRRLAQLLEAYASVNELDAIDVTISSANHESEIVRRAARASLAVYGRNAKWSFHREYENQFGEEPTDGDYEQWAQALYDEWDKQRDIKTVALYQLGHGAAALGHFVDMDVHYRKLLSMSPLNPQRHQMASDYLLYAGKLEEEGTHDKAIAATRMARRLAEEGSDAEKKATARLAWLHAEAFRAKGALDVNAYKDIRREPALKQHAEKWAIYGNGDKETRAFPIGPVVLVSFMVFASALLLFWRIRARANEG